VHDGTGGFLCAGNGSECGAVGVGDGKQRQVTSTRRNRVK
jgi:hypothetical protein